MTIDSARPLYHFTPPANWMNDPNGMVYYKDEYHLFYQYYPGGFEAGERYTDPLKWGPMHWGHAVSRDLIHWQHLPIALYPDSAPGEQPILGMVFSGSAVVDWHNTSGLRSGDEEVLVACFTQTDTPEILDQRQCIAYSNDRGRTWTKYAGNPVLANPGLQDYRDPKVFWHDPSGRWVMIVSAGNHLELNTSPDLIHWTHASDFGGSWKSGTAAWECPDLFELPIDGDPERRLWVIIVSVQDEGPQGGSGTQYFIGHFDGTRFEPAMRSGELCWLDYGRDNYAGVTWSDHPDNDRQRLLIGWMTNFDYSQEIPARNYRGVMTLPRKLSLRSFSEGVRLVSEPIDAVQLLRRPPPLIRIERERIDGNRPLGSGITLEVIAEFRMDGTTATEFGFRLRKKEGAEVCVAYDRRKQQMWVDRGRSGGYRFNKDTGPHAALLSPEDGMIRLHILLDTNSIEVFGNHGRRVITDLIFPPEDAVEAELFVSQGAVEMDSLLIYELNRA